METFELRYFVEVAKHQNINQAARDISVSPASLSKAVARLESELGVKLFDRVSRGIKLTNYGKFLQARASEILRLEESVKLEIGGHKEAFQIRMAGREVLLAKMGVDLFRQIRSRYDKASCEFIAMSEAETVHAISTGQAHIGLVTLDPPSNLTSQILLKSKFITCVGKGHSLYEKAKTGKEIEIGEVLQHDFVCPDRPVLGQMETMQSMDGWRDDQFPRRITAVAGSLKTLEEMLVQGMAVAYLPDYFVATLPVKALTIVGCPYSCRQTVRIIARDPQNLGWLNELF